MTVIQQLFITPSKLWDILEKKKSCTYYEQDPEKVEQFLKELNNLSHLTPVYIDEIGFETYFHQEYGRSLKGQLIKGKVSGRRYQRISLVAGLINGVLIAPMTYKDTMTSDFFEAWFKTFLLPTLGKPSVIIMDNAKFHRMSKLKDLDIDCYPFLLTHQSIILSRKHGLISKNTSEEYCRIAIRFLRYFYPVLVSVGYIIPLRKHGLISKHTSEEYCQIAILFLRQFHPALVSVDYISYLLECVTYW